MRFRRRSGFRRGPREPLHWARTSFSGSPFQVPNGLTQVSQVPLFTPSNFIAGANVDDAFTVRRVVINRQPIHHFPDDVTLLTSPVVPELTWFIFPEDQGVTALNQSPVNVFSRGTDIIAGGHLQASVFQNNAQTTAWASQPTQNWIDTKVNRRINTSDSLYLWLFHSISPNCNGGTPVVPGEDGAGCWICNFDVSVLYQRSMRKR